MAEILVESLRSRSGASTRLEGFDLRVRDGEVLVLVGPEPSAASLLLDVVAGIEPPGQGRVLIDGVPLQEIAEDEAPPLLRPPAPRPAKAGRMTVAAALTESSPPADDPLMLASLLGLGALLDTPVTALSEADWRRLALAHALLGRPSAMLLDEPTLGLPPAERERLSADVIAAVAAGGTTTLYATSDVDEALRVGDRLAYISGGRLRQLGTPARLLEDPVSLDVALFLGGERLPAAPGRISELEIALPAGPIPRPAHVPPPDAGEREVVYAAWPRQAAAVTERAVPGQPPTVRVGQGAEPAMVFDPGTRVRLDRATGAAARSVNILVGAAGTRVLAEDDRLAVSTRYRLIVWIGAHDARSIVTNAAERAFPDALLPRAAGGHRLQLVAHSAELELGRSSRAVLLPTHGPSRPVNLGFRTPAQPGTGTIRLSFYHRRHVLQSLLLDVSWSVAPEVPAVRARIDYTVSDLDDVARLPERDLSLVVNETVGGQHRVIVNGREESPFGVALYEQQMTQSLASARRALLTAHRDPKKGRSLYDDGNAKGHDAFVADLTLLAHRGAALLEQLFGDNVKRRNRLVARLREAAVERNGEAIVQIARAAGSKLDFPWHLVYDIGLGVFTKRSERPCRVLELWHPHAEPAALPPLCPYREEHGRDTICPYGFWGLAHILELPPTIIDPTRSMPLCVHRGELSAKMLLGLSRRLDKRATERHLGRLPRAVAHEECDGRQRLEAAMAQPERELIYFYCHGRRAFTEHYGADTPLLELGDQEFVSSGDVTSWASLESGWPHDHWESTPPLVVINGCHTAEITPMQSADFVSAFVGIGAAGVVGTEVAISQPVASEAAELLLGELVSGETVGAALRSMRRTLLAKGNVMGLAYTAYCSANLVLRCQPH